MKARTAIRKTAKWGGAALFVTIFVAWIASNWITCIGGGGRTALRIEPGCFMFGRHERLLPLYFNWDTTTGDPFLWEFGTAHQGFWDPEGAIWIPMWAPLVLVAVPTALAWRFDAAARRRESGAACRKCGYSRQGLLASTVCPECGAAASAVVKS